MMADLSLSVGIMLCDMLWIRAGGQECLIA